MSRIKAVCGMVASITGRMADLGWFVDSREHSFRKRLKKRLPRQWKDWRVTFEALEFLCTNPSGAQAVVPQLTRADQEHHRLYDNFAMLQDERQRDLL